MSAPYIIWTMQRTGGTTLAALFAGLSEYQGIQHEPFNPERVLHWIHQNWLESRDPDKLRADLAKGLANTPLIKHCYELMPPELNRALMEVSSSLGYRHIILDRRAEPKRILSLELAKLTGAWGKQEAGKIYRSIEAGDVQLEAMDQARAMHHMAVCQSKRRELSDLLDSLSQTAFVIYFEDVYTDPEAGRRRIRDLVDFLEIKVDALDDYETRVNDALLKRGQNSSRIMESVPNIDEVRAALDAAFQKDPFLFQPS